MGGTLCMHDTPFLHTHVLYKRIPEQNNDIPLKINSKNQRKHPQRVCNTMYI